ncbi:MAG TPA: hypothetical protein VG755_16825 [Nannocystaceae bacterium]|nr:hypothetical protein [Nannocystaceae bacterium]
MTLRGCIVSVALGSALACTAALEPKDQVTRCGNADDCDPTGDNRYVSLCKFAEGSDPSKVDGICVADYDPSIECDPTKLMGTLDHPITIAAGKSACAKTSCDPLNNGKLGCPTDDGSCSEGMPLELGEYRYCGADDVVPGFGLPDELELKHISDMYCRSYFCDEDFVCGPNGKCQPCEGNDFLQGGCGTIYIDGAPAPVYVLDEALTEACAGEDVETMDAVFGDACIDA